MQLLNYQIHILLNSKYKLFINMLIYIIIVLLYEVYIHETNIVECMIRSDLQSTPEPETDIIDNLMKQINVLTQENERLNELRIIEKARYKVEIETLEENQLHLIRENRLLKSQLLEAKETIGIAVGDNMDLRSKLIVQQEYIEGLRRNLARVEKHNEELSLALIESEKYKI